VFNRNNEGNCVLFEVHEDEERHFSAIDELPSKYLGGVLTY
jgi:hypothetical protein